MAPIAKVRASRRGVHKRGYLKVRDELPDVADSVLMGTISYDPSKKRLVKTYLSGLSKEPSRDYFDLRTGKATRSKDQAPSSPKKTPKTKPSKKSKKSRRGS